MTDNDGTTGTFDIPIFLEREMSEGGYVSDMWAHFALSVTTTGVQTYLDGVEVDWTAYGFRGRDRNPVDNIAYPNPTQFQVGQWDYRVFEP